MEWRKLTVVERNALVAERVLGLVPTKCNGDIITCDGDWSCTDCGIAGNYTGNDFDRFIGHMKEPLHYTENMQDAMRVIRKMRNDHSCQWSIIIDPDPANKNPNGITLSATVKGKVQTVAYVGTFLAETICFVALRFLLGTVIEWG